MTTDDAGSAPGADAGSPSGSTEPAPPEPTPAETTSPDLLAEEKEDEGFPEQLVARVTAPQHARMSAWRRALPGHTDGGGRREAFRAWRHSRPFPGGLLLILAGIELLAIPISGVLVKGALKLVIYIGIGGVFGVLIGVLLIAAGIMLWVNPAHRVFYGIAGIVLGILSFPASNLGGFFIAMLLGIIGGALGFAWAPVDATPAAAVRGDPARGAEKPSPAAGPRAWRLRGRSIIRGHRVFAVATMPALLVAGMLGTSGHASAPQSADGCILGIICLGPSSSPSPQPSSPGPSTQVPAPKPSPSPACPSASPSPSPSPKPTPTPTPDPSCSSTPTPGGGPSAGASPSPSGNGSSGATGSGKPGKKKKAAPAKQIADPGLTAPNATSVLDAGSATLTSFSFKGIVNMPVGGGGTQKMMKFAASSATLADGVTVTVTQSGQATVTTSPTLGFSGGMTLYATKLCGKLAGIPLCFTPSTVSAVLLSIANLLTGVLPITLTNVVTDQPLAVASGLQTGPLSIGF
jgi:uncharacterized protein DUF6114